MRDRRDDIKLLSSYFVRRYCQKMQSEEKTIADEAMNHLLSYKWPGNVRELENVLEHAILLSKGNQITQADLPEKITQQEEVELVTEERPASPTLEAIEKAYIFWTLSQTGWQKSKAASILGIDASTLYRKIEKYRLRSPSSLTIET